MSGFWGPVTATLDWCEANYQFSHYIAELANSVSNTYSISLALFGLATARKERLAGRYLIAYTGFLLVGLGSFAFHSSLLYEAQLADELPMVFLASNGVLLLFDTEPGTGYDNVRSIGILVAALSFNVMFAWTYATIWRNPVYHQVVFAIGVFGMVFRVMYLLRCKTAANKEITPQARADTHYCFTCGPAVFALGFLVWNLDNMYCSTLTRWKQNVGWPAAFLLEGHSWWHILTGYGAYTMLTGVIFLSLSIKDRRSKYTMKYYYGAPYIHRVGSKDPYHER